MCASPPTHRFKTFQSGQDGRGDLTMTAFRSWIFILLLACLGLAAAHAQQAASDFDQIRGASYVITVTDTTTGTFDSRGVLTLHSDGTMSAIDSGQGAPPSSSAASSVPGSPTTREAQSAGRSISISRRTQMWRVWIIPSNSAPTGRRSRGPSRLRPFRSRAIPWTEAARSKGSLRSPARS